MNRKEIVQALEEKWGVKAKYLGMPSCAYEITGEKGTFRIDREGRVLDPEGREYEMAELLADAPAPAGQESKPADIGESNIQGYAFSLEGHTVISLRNLVNMLASKQDLLCAAFGLEQPILERSLAEELDPIPIEDVNAFVAIWRDLERGRAAGLKLDLATRTLVLQLPKENPTLEEMAAFRDLAAGMDASAKKLKHTSFKPAQDENPKFAFRTWLIRLGMNGDEFKATRKVLLAKLTGNSSFRRDPGVRAFLDAYHGCDNSSGAEGGC